MNPDNIRAAWSQFDWASKRQRDFAAARKEQPELFVYFEVMDRVAMIDEFLAVSLAGHAVIDKDHRLGAAFYKAQEALGELYQLAGEVFNEEADKRGM